ncbi:hypothetical protein MBM_01071 [Drepanopeziza brunnea f. sp. 'multigermtubi' MB_m1]|uniref:Uncharacterized protein n=1 Tax=Marssonina brunnea f. sp. multigermtubi (strain MB_m1) TaxID=1072389 RepID=K1Y5D2_MARBU|nr:uncharacterized protein MBM_01071 [Drepanopeziza brunnea f. sp. 'multigermtubi' MB_m1]EKD20389.1 hypothetical protein MBM_01071 [Drepanopeziza brunnea f. sp. 'multigermtubi' MB_m1]
MYFFDFVGAYTGRSELLSTASSSSTSSTTANSLPHIRIRTTNFFDLFAEQFEPHTSLPAPDTLPRTFLTPYASISYFSYATPRCKTSILALFHQNQGTRAFGLQNNSDALALLKQILEMRAFAKPASGSDTSEGDTIGGPGAIRRPAIERAIEPTSGPASGPAIGRLAIERAIEPTSGPASGPAIRRQASGPAIGPARSAIEGIVSFDQGTFGVLLLRYFEAITSHTNYEAPSLLVTLAATFEATSSANCATSTTY